MTIRPIIFSAPMVLALLAAGKTQTRRLATSPLKYCAIGDQLYVRESMGWDRGATDRLFYKADGATINAEPPADYQITSAHASSIHMPRWASRLTLEVVSVRIQWLNEISDEDIGAEGLTTGARLSFISLWNSLHPAQPWLSNPQVVALSFTVHKCNVDQMANAA